MRGKADPKVRLAAAALGVWAFACALPARAVELHPAVTVRAALVEFYAGHLVLDCTGGATLDDGVLHVSANRIVVDLTNDRFVAAGDVSVAGAQPMSGVALGVDLHTHRGVLIALSPAPLSYDVDGAAIHPQASSAAPQALPLPDLGSELPFVDAAEAVAHLGADVRLEEARVLVPGGRSVLLPSYVYVFSSETGYSASNVGGSGEDVPILYGSTRDSVDGAHFEYNPVTKVGIGLDHRIVDGDKAYDLFSISPIYGPFRNAAFTWQEQINAHASQTLNALAADRFGSSWTYNLIDGLHRSFFDLTGDSAPGGNNSALAWQGAYEPLGAGWLSLFSYHLRTQYGREQLYGSGAPPLYSTSFEGALQTSPMSLDPSSSLSLSGDWRQTFDDLPHRQFAVTYGATLTHRWDPMLTTTLSDFEVPVSDRYPSLDEGTREYTSQQLGTVSYNHGDSLAFTLLVEHQAAFSVPAGIGAQPWFTSLDVRFRVNSTLSLDLSRSYGFGFEGQRFGQLGVQIFP